MRAAIYTPHPTISHRWEQKAGERYGIEEVPFIMVQPPHRKDYQEKGQKVIRGYNGNALSIHANLIPINDWLMFSDWTRPDKQKRDIAVLFLDNQVLLLEYPDKSFSIDARIRRVSAHISKHPVYGRLYQH